MDPSILTVLCLAAMVTLAAAATGAWAQGVFGGFLLGLGAILASALCIAGTWIGRQSAGSTGAWAGLVLGILAGAAFAWPTANRVVGGRSGRFAALSWLGLCSALIFGHLAGGRIGIVLIGLPAIVAFWIGLFRVSAYLLPRRDESQRPEVRLVAKRRNSEAASAGSAHKNQRAPRPEFALWPPKGFGHRLRRYVEYWRRSQWRQVFRSLLTYSIGTNYPYYTLAAGRVELRRAGNRYRQFFAGPGLTYADCDQAGYLSDGIRVKSVLEPGLSFTGLFDLDPKVIDLRPQLCSFDVEAVTRDGIAVRVTTHVPFQIQSGKQVDGSDGNCVADRVQLGKPFPFRRRAVYWLARMEPVERQDPQAAGSQRHGWSTDLVPMIARRIVQNIVSRYGVDELCAPLDPDRLPCLEIAREMSARLEEALAPFGLELVAGGAAEPEEANGAAEGKVNRCLARSGAWIGNLVPLDEAVVARRLDNWKTEWEGRILMLMGEARAERARQIERARADAELSILWRFGQVARAATLSDPASQTALALRFIDCLGEVLSETESQWPLPESLRGTLQRLRGQIDEGQR